MSEMGQFRRTKPVMPARSCPLRSESDVHPALPRNDEMGHEKTHAVHKKQRAFPASDHREVGPYRSR